MRVWHPEEIRKLTAQADYTVLQTARLRGELVPIAAVESFFGRALMAFRQQMEDTIPEEADETQRDQLDGTLRILSRALDDAMEEILRSAEGADADGGEAADSKAAPKRLRMGRSQSDFSPRNQRKKPKGATKVFRRGRASPARDAGGSD